MMSTSFWHRLWLVFLVLVLIYPAHQVADLGWTVIPIWALAARQITRLKVDFSEDFLPEYISNTFNIYLVGICLDEFHWIV